MISGLRLSMGLGSASRLLPPAYFQISAGGSKMLLPYYILITEMMISGLRASIAPRTATQLPRARNALI